MSRLDDGGEVNQAGSARYRPEAEADRWVDRPQAAQVAAGESGVGGYEEVQIMGAVPLAASIAVRPRVRTPGGEWGGS